MSSESKPNAAMTDEERLELAAKLDKELDDYISKLPKRKPHEGGEMDDNWIEEFEKHPFFMKKPPEPGEELHPLYEGLQKLKYDPEENTPKELAISYKDDGNFNFKHRKYRLAVLSYTEGIRVRCGDADVEATLHNNRAAANYFLKNYRSCVRDCDLALKLKPDYDKAAVRAANASYEINRYDEAIAYCDRLLDKRANNAEMLELRRKCVQKSKERLRDARKKEAEARRRKKEEEKIVEAILKRGVQIEERKDTLKLECLEPRFPELAAHRVYLTEDGRLVWPVVFMYPEYQIMDFVQEFCETDPFVDQLNNVFAETPEWDKLGAYTLNNLNVYYEDRKKTSVRKVDTERTLLQILQEKDFLVRGGTPSFIVLVRGSAPEKSFLEKY